MFVVRYKELFTLYMLCVGYAELSIRKGSIICALSWDKDTKYFYANSTVGNIIFLIGVLCINET